MTDETPQPPQGEEPANSTNVEEAPQADSSAHAPEEISYEQYLKLVNPDKSDEEIAKMVRKENRYVWLGRFQLLAFLLIIILVLVLIFIK